MQFRLTISIVILTLVSISTDLYAQYKGGNANGGDRKELIKNVCGPSENTSIYFGGDANGASTAIHKPLTCGSPENTSIYFGGEASGAAQDKMVKGTCPPSENLNIFSGGNSGRFAIRIISCTPPESGSIFFGGNANGNDSKYYISCPVANASVPNIFAGGIANGYSKNALAQQACLSPENLNIFEGGTAAGTSVKRFNQQACTTPESLNIFVGGSANGDATGVLSQQTCTPAENMSIFLGGNADGYSLKLLAQKTCDAVENFSIFFGGKAEGYSAMNLMQSICTDPENIDIFTGGNADGMAAGLLVQTVCATPENINIFTGGNADGYQHIPLIQMVCAEPENTNIFKGGSADGYQRILLNQQACGIPENINIYTGGLANGDAFGKLVTCTQPEVVNIYFGGIANGAALSSIITCPDGIQQVNIFNGGDANGSSSFRLIKTACAPPQNISIYFGGGANGAETFRYLKNVCPAPENQNIYLGGNANGASCLAAITSACPLPENLNIYLGSNGNGASYLVNRPTVCPPSENWNIFFGGKADGYAVRMLVQPYYWTGAIDHNWHDSGNWSTDMVPDINAQAIIPDVANDPVITDEPAFAKGIVLHTGATLTVDSKDLTVANTLDNDGAITITGNPLIAIGGNLKSDNGAFISGNSTVVFNASSGTQQVSINTGDFYDVEVNTTNGATCQLNGTIGIRGNMAIVTGELNGGASTISIRGSWSDYGNFTPATSRVVFNGSYQTIKTASSEKFYNMTVTAGNQVVLNGNVMATNELALQGGTILTGSNLLTVGQSAASAGTISYTSGRIVGKLERWIATPGSYLFPIGSPSNMYALNLTVTSGLTPGSVAAYFVSSNPGVGGLPLTESGIPIEQTFTEGFWNATAQNGLILGSYNISLEANAFSSYIFGSSTRLVRRTNSGGWKLDGTHTPAIIPTAFRTGLTGGISPLGTQFALAPASCSGGQILDNVNICTTTTVPPFTNQTLAVGGTGTFTYTWQYSNNLAATPGDGSWTDVSGPSSDTYSVGAPLPNSQLFVRKAVGTGCPTPVYSNAVTVTVNPLPKTGAVYHIGNNIAK